MNRDGATISVWQDKQDENKTQSVWDAEKIYDVLIVGGGITGLTTALMLQNAGKTCILTERYNIGFGTTGGTTAHLNTLLDVPYNVITSNFNEHAATLTANAASDAIKQVKDYIDLYAIDCDFSYQDGYIYATNEQEEQELNNIYKAYNTTGLSAEFTNEIPLTTPFVKAFKAGNQATFHPIKYIKGLARAFEAAGGTLLQQNAFEKSSFDDYHTAETTLGIIKAQDLIYATHIPLGLSILNARLVAYRSYVIAVPLTADAAYTNGLTYNLKNPFNYFRKYVADNKEYLLVGGMDHKAGDEADTEKRFEELEDYVQQFVRFTPPSFRWSSQYFDSVDGLPFIGAMPGNKNTYVATGFGGNGLIYGTIAASVICKLLTEGETELSSLYNPSRIKPIAGFSEFVRANADVAAHFISGRLSFEDISSITGLANEEARLIKKDGKKLGVYKDANGKIVAVNPICPHAKCVVEWNGAEKTWDCPCHGARFSPTGAVINGPATQDLELYQWEKD